MKFLQPVETIDLKEWIKTIPGRPITKSILHEIRYQISYAEREQEIHREPCLYENEIVLLREYEKQIVDKMQNY